MATVYITPTGQPAGIPPCCPAYPTGCRTAATACGACLHGCPAPAGAPCCLDAPAQPATAVTDQTARPMPTFDEIRACGHTPDQHRTIDGLEADLRTTTREHGEALEQLTQAWAALNAAGYTHPTASVAEVIAQLAEERDVARHLLDVRTTALSRRTRDLTATLRVVDAVRIGTLEDIDRAMAAYDAPGDLAGPVDARRRMAAERPDSAGEGEESGDDATEAHRGAEGFDGSLTDRLAGALAHALSLFTEPHPLLNTIRSHWVERYILDALRAVYAEWANQVAPEGRETDDAPPPGSGPDRAQGSLTRCCAHPGCPRTYRADVGPQDRGWRRLRGLTVLCPDHAGPEPLPEPTPAERAEHGPTVTKVLDDVRAGRPATTREG